ncbi:gliding motility-associated C-terminal domain-containing protein [Chryseobacterium shandongense]|uniref:Gliding motility-associated C-terminal domain-containing protein n=1 Tax=Chryseobacterium shandongense TaxID=1493872 RepID=A0AAD1DL30_9FLAO|nr:choice-of-anchor L domain-containing protein [Chryseobacterium shandongense]AZA86391.1 gliding motility-associated C-terminal domain-containing protein [Chryseobacterium shandongense]AZA94801.1 gliding motility-associated C-terminal domain-containing protein [Chryseobacterium shandongense]
MKRYLLLFSLFAVSSSSLFYSQNITPRKPQKEKASSLTMKAGAFIDVNAAGYAPSDYTPLQLVKDVLISSGTNSCVTPTVSNVQVSPNLPATNAQRSWGYFHKGTTNFPFQDGIVLSTGYANKAGNNYISSTLGDDLPTGSDPDLVAATNPSATLNDAVILEFDFVPTSSQVKFNYLFASEEYTGSFPCSFSDAFALLLRPTAGGPYVNMAILPAPGTGPVSVTNIHPQDSFTGFDMGCGAPNVSFFGGYNTSNIETNFNGRTVPLQATATVVPGQSYHFKMVLADAIDSSYDSAVFLEGGSFNIGVELLDPNGGTLPEEINVCDNIPQVITASVNDPNMNYQWFYNGVAIQGATTPTITATQPGNYEIQVTFPGNPCPGKASIKINGGTTPAAVDASLLLCSTPDVTWFDLTDAMPSISTTPGAVFTFYEDQADALAQNDDNIQDILHYNGNDGQVLYVVVSNGGFCSKMVELTLLKETRPTVSLVASKLKVCPGSTVELTATGGSTYEWANFQGTGNVQTATVYTTTTFSVYALGAKGCQSSLPAKVTVEVVPELTSPLRDVEMCQGDRITLDAGAGPNYSYLWSTGEITQTINVDNWGVYTVKIDNGYCEKTFTVNVLGAASPFVSNVDYSNNTLTITAEVPTINNIPQTAEYSIDGGISWQDSNVFTNVQDNATYNIQVRSVGTHCVGALEFFTFQVKNIITPNDDGINDTLDLTALGGFNNFTGSIYDRYGSEMFRFSKENPIWNGTVGGKKLPTATYWYKFNFQYPKTKVNMSQSGWIMLKNRE